MNNNDEFNNKESNIKKILNEFKATEEARQRLEDLNDKKKRKYHEFLSYNAKELAEKSNDLNMAIESINKSRRESKGMSMQTYNTLASFYMEMAPGFESLFRAAIAGKDILVLQGIRVYTTEEGQWFFWDNFTSQNKQFDISDLQYLTDLGDNGYIEQACIAECLEGRDAATVLQKVNDDLLETVKEWIESVDGLEDGCEGYFVGPNEANVDEPPKYRIFSKVVGQRDEATNSWSLDERNVLDQESFKRLRDGENNPGNSLGDFLLKKYHDVTLSEAPRPK